MFQSLFGMLVPDLLNHHFSMLLFFNLGVLLSRGYNPLGLQSDEMLLLGVSDFPRLRQLSYSLLYFHSFSSPYQFRYPIITAEVLNLVPIGVRCYISPSQSAIRFLLMLGQHGFISSKSRASVFTDNVLSYYPSTSSLSVIALSGLSTFFVVAVVYCGFRSFRQIQDVVQYEAMVESLGRLCVLVHVV